MDRISRGSFIRKAALGAAALAGVGASSDTWPFPQPENPNIIAYRDRLVVYPSGDPETDLANLQSALYDYTQPKIYLNPKSRSGSISGFTLPEWSWVEITRDAELVGSNTVISGGDVAFHCSESFSLGIRNIIMRGQSTASVLGYFNNLGLVASGSDPIPLPEPASYGFVLRLSGSLSIVNSYVRNAKVGIFAEGMQSGHISSSNIQSDVCSVFLDGSGVIMSGNRTETNSLSNITVFGQNCHLEGNRFSGRPIANILILPSALNTFVNLGGGSVSSGSDPIPLPKPIAIDMGVNSRLLGNYDLLPPPPYILGQIEELYAEIDSLFYGEEGGPDIRE